VSRFLTSAFLALIVACFQVAPSAAQSGPPRPDTINYVVRAGDTLIDLAETGFIRPADYRQVQTLNHVANPRRMPVGLILTIPTNLLRSGPASARLVGFRGEVSIANGTTRRGAAIGATASEGSTVTTGANAFARFSLPDGSYVAVPSQSSIRFVRLRSYALNNALDSEIAVESGRAESQVAPVRPLGGFRIRTPLSVTAVRGTEFRVSYDAQTSQTSTEVLHGVVGVSTRYSSETEAVGTNQALLTNTTGSHLVDLLERPHLVEPDAVQTAPNLSFVVSPLQGAASYRAVLSRDAEGQDVVGEARSATGTERIEFPAIEDGSYFVRLTALSNDGAEGLPATYPFTRLGSLIRGMNVAALDPLRFRFTWIDESDPAGYSFELRRRDGLQPGIVQELDTPSPEAVVSVAEGGDYEWRVRSIRHLKGKAIAVWSPFLSLRIGR
jgi:hypothetical protein